MQHHHLTPTSLLNRPPSWRLTREDDMTDNPLGIVQRLLALAHAAELSIATLDKPHVARVCHDAVGEIQHLRRRIDGLTTRLDRLRRETGQCC
jgi:hypothetical protein